MMVASIPLKVLAKMSISMLEAKSLILRDVMHFHGVAIPMITLRMTILWGSTLHL